ncbi:MAG: spore germination protein [Clostridia bacterium]|jgi:spore germination protein KA|nr:spore germination protein [Clostridia bacterium]MDD4275526.1 spore germination protein [Clostridia bacterium]
MLNSKKLEINKIVFSNGLNNCPDLIMREFKICKKISACLVYLNTLVDADYINRDIISKILDLKDVKKKDIFKYIKENVISNSELKVVELESHAIDLILTGNAILLIDGEDKAIALSIQGWKLRPIQEPPNSVAIKGPREGFTEDIKINISLLRRRLVTPDLYIEEKTVGKYTKTKICVCYINTIVDKEIVKEINKKLNEISIDGIIDSAYIQEFLEPLNDSIFKQSGSSERPDVITSRLLEGRVAILVDGSPVVITIPFVLIEDFQNPEDYYGKTARAIFVRSIRFIGIMFSLFLPGIYVSVLLYHYRVIPLRLLITIANAIEGIPMTPVIETFFIIILFEILYEASLRMPKYLGMALSIVGGIIIGDMAIKSGIVSPPALIVVALSGLTIYTAPDAAPQLFIMRIGFTIMGAMLGFLGIVLGIVFVLARLSNFDSYGAAYLGPWAPNIPSGKNDAIVKAKTKNMSERPESIPNINNVRTE